MKYLPLLLLLAYNSFSQAPVPVFQSGLEGHLSYRIPAMIRLPNGTLLAFCEGRVNGSGDFGDINIVMKKSEDGGKTWSALQTLVDADSLQAGNPAPVVDLTDPLYPQGRIFLFYNTGNNHENEVRKGKGLREAWWISSADGGQHWTAPVNITAQVHRPNHPPYQFSEDWRSYANTPGHALQFSGGKYHGRIYVAANHSAGPPQAGFKDYHSHGYYTDDHGKTFHLNKSLNWPGSNEATAAQWGRSGLILNARNQNGAVKARIVAHSNNGGESWQEEYADPQLPDPVCQGSMMNLGTKGKKQRLAFCNAADTIYRNHLTLHLSKDGGRSWKKHILIEKGVDPKRDPTAYSDIVQLNKKEMGVLYERNNYSSICFTVVRF